MELDDFAPPLVPAGAHAYEDGQGYEDDDEPTRLRRERRRRRDQQAVDSVLVFCASSKRENMLVRHIICKKYTAVQDCEQRRFASSG